MHSDDAVTRTLDVSGLPSYGYSHRNLMWWGTLGLMAIEGTAFAMAVVGYFYIRSLATTWPLSSFPPALAWGTVNTFIVLVSILPNHWAKQAAEVNDVAGVRLWLVVSALFGVLFMAVRVLEFGSLNVRWDSNAYGSMVWLLMGLHTTHIVTDWFDTVVLATLFFTGPIEGRRFVDVSENSMYWYFVVFSWLPIYLVVYWAPRTL